MKRRRRWRFIAGVLIAIFILTVTPIILFDKSLSYQLQIYSKQIALNRISSEINKAIYEELSEAQITYDTIMKTENDINGRLTAVKADMIAVNILKNKLDIAVSEVCTRDESYEMKIPIGNILGNSFFYGDGFDISIKFRPVGRAVTNMSGNFTETGINQTLYRVSFDVDVDVAIVFPFRYVEIPLQIETVIAETVIVGEVPDSFTHFDLNGDITSQDFQGYVEDYMAE